MPAPPYPTVAPGGVVQAPTLAQAAAAIGITVGCGPVNPRVPLEVNPKPWNFPTWLDQATDYGAYLVQSVYGGTVNLHAWALNTEDLSHLGPLTRYTGPGQYDFAGVDETYAWAVANGLPTSLYGPEYGGIPVWIQNGGYTQEQVTELLYAWYEAQFSRWPLLSLAYLANELGSSWTRWWIDHTNIGAGSTIGPTIDEAFGKNLCVWARALNPNVKVLVSAPFDPTVPVATWRAAGVPLDGVGYQNHITSADPLPPNSTMPSVAAVGLETHVIELDVLSGATTQAEVATRYANALATWLGYRTVRHLSTWKLADPPFPGDSSLMPGDPGYVPALPFDKNLAPNQCYSSLVSALQAASLPTNLSVRCVYLGGTTAQLSGYVAVGGTVTVTPSVGSAGTVTYPVNTSTVKTWACTVTGVSAGATITVSDGTHSPQVVLAPLLTAAAHNFAFTTLNGPRTSTSVTATGICNAGAIVNVSASVGTPGAVTYGPNGTTWSCQITETANGAAVTATTSDGLSFTSTIRLPVATPLSIDSVSYEIVGWDENPPYDPIYGTVVRGTVSAGAKVTSVFTDLAVPAWNPGTNGPNDNGTLVHLPTVSGTSWSVTYSGVALTTGNTVYAFSSLGEAASLSLRPVIAPPAVVLGFVAPVPSVRALEGPVQVFPVAASLAFVAPIPAVRALVTTPGDIGLRRADGSPIGLRYWNGSRWADAKAIKMYPFN